MTRTVPAFGTTFFDHTRTIHTGSRCFRGGAGLDSTRLPMFQSRMMAQGFLHHSAFPVRLGWEIWTGDDGVHGAQTSQGHAAHA